MKKKINYRRLINIVLITFLLGALVNQCMENKARGTKIEMYKDIIIEKDSLRKVREGHYQKIVDDRATKKDLEAILKKNNSDLLYYILKQGKTPIMYTQVEAVPDSKTDTVYIDTKYSDDKMTKSFSAFYPNREDYFINYNGIVKDSLITGKWNFNPFELDIVVSEKTKGIYEVDLGAPEWMQVRNIKVNSLPLENIKPDKFDFFVGGNLGVDVRNYKPVFEAETGFRLNKTLISILGNTNSEVKIGFKKLL